MFITFEGIEGCGKTTQAKLLYEALVDRKYSVVFTREPGGTPAAEELRSFLLKPREERFPPFAELSVYEAARAFHVENLIKPSLKEGAVVICDRFIDSTLAYQGYGRGIDLSLVERLNQEATGGLKPDLTVLLDLPVEEAFRRISERQKDRMESESLKFHRKVREGFLEIARREPERFLIVDGKREVEELHTLILGEVLGRLGAL